ncbi:MAG: MltA domain-containing protein [Candidatus Sulfomarinibacteraceae bacterium]
MAEHLFVRRCFVAAALAVMLGACAHVPETPPDQAILRVVPVGQWPELDDDLDGVDLSAACDPSLAFLDRIPADRVFTFGALQRTGGALAAGVRRACEIAVMPPAERQRVFQNEFLLVRSVGRDGGGEVLFTGYYEPLLDARREPAPPFDRPVYGVPDDLVTVDLGDFGVEADRPRIIGMVEDRRLVPYRDRDDIDFGAGLASGADVLGWVDDPVDVFFLHVQGSGTLVFEDGSRIRAGYATTNGRPYRSIGKLLIDDGLVSREDMSMQAIRGYLEQHPEELPRVLGFNPSYVFFRELPATGGPLGCYGEPVTGGRSIATDRALFPAPILAWIRATVPTADGGNEPIARFVLNQDTGGSIRGPGRVDLFMGQGDEAGEIAGRTKHLGELYFLIPK